MEIRELRPEDDYVFLMEYCIHCHYEYENYEYAGRYAQDWSVQCPECSKYQTREEYRQSHLDATNEDLGCPNAIIGDEYESEEETRDEQAYHDQIQKEQELRL